MINVFKNNNVNLGFSVKLIYQITAHHTETETMRILKGYFNNIGHIEYSPDGKYVSYRVYKIEDILKEIFPHFNCYPLQSTKHIYYALWSKSAILMDQKLHLTESGFKLPLTYKAAFTKKLDAEVFNNYLYSDVVPFDVSSIIQENEIKLNLHYVAGFTAADGSFSVIKPSSIGKWPNYDAFYRIHQNTRDRVSLETMCDIIGCGKVYNLKDGMCNLAVRNKNQLADIVIPFFDTYPLNAKKHLYFLQFKKAVCILRKNLGKGFAHLTEHER